jgi:hypothetical protein
MSLFNRQISPGTHGLYDLSGTGIVQGAIGVVHVTTASGNITAREVWLWKDSTFPDAFAMQWGAPEVNGQPVSPRSPTSCCDYEKKPLPANTGSYTVPTDGTVQRVFEITKNDESTACGYLEVRLSDARLTWCMYTTYVTAGQIDFIQNDVLKFNRHAPAVGAVICHSVHCPRTAAM